MAESINITSLNKEILAGSKVALAKGITLIESNKAEHRAMADELINSILPYSGKSLRIGITGVPWVGKSTFIEALCLYLI